MLRRLLAGFTVAIAVLAGLAGIAAPAQADGGTYCNELGRCYMLLSYKPADPAPNPNSNGWTSGAPTCYFRTSESQATAQGYTPDEIYVWSQQDGYTEWYVIISCGNGERYWSNNRQCYVGMVSGEWPTRPSQYSQEAGYYYCALAQIGPGGGVDDSWTYFWSEAIPPGLTVLTPGAAAQQLISTFQLRGIDIGMAPEVNPAWGHRRGYVGMPIWLWVNNPEPLTWGPYSETATLGGQTITATAQVTSIRWTMGDGSSITCGNTGTPYNLGYGVTTSPTCGYRYTTTSSRTPGDRFAVTATSNWTVTWTSAAGAAGTVNTTTASTVDLEVNELQTVIVP
ncbi:hypothetical protein [Microbacterium lacticum]|uniref:hypothetical protein n=1 Tax=Microbacterium lacticum TaxID=33885 RepID=UPI001F5A1466|nr:hypothetical protein [Microbacterium lacticum]